MYSFILMMVPGFVCILFLDSLNSKIVGIVCLWACVEVSFGLISVFINEFLVKPYRNFSNSICRASQSFGAFFGTFMTLYLQDYKQIVCLYFATFFLYILVIFFAFPRSPSYLLKQKKTDELTKAIIRIATINRFPEEQLGAVLVNLDNIVASKIFIGFNQ